MKWLIIIGILISVSFPTAFADYRGENYLDIDNGDGTHTWKGNLSPWIDTGIIENGKKKYVHHIIDNQPTYIKVTNGEASFVFDKTTCSAKIYEGGLINNSNDFILGSDSYVPKSSVDGSGTWSVVTSVNNASCVTTIQETATSIKVTGTKSSSAGIFKISYLKEDGKRLKTILEATNLTALTDRRFGVTQTQSIPQIITWAGQQRDLANYVGKTFDRNWLENNKANLSNLFIYNGLAFDVIDAWDNLESITVNSVSNGMASVSFNYLRNTPILLPNETLIIDPTFGWSAYSTAKVVFTDQAAVGTCGTFTSTADFSAARTLGASASGDAGGRCWLAVVEDDFSSITAPTSITSVKIRMDLTNDSGMVGCDYNALNADIGANTPSQLATMATTGTSLVNDNTACGSNGSDVEVTLGSTANSLLLTEINSGNGIWGIGIIEQNYNTRPAVARLIDFASFEWEVVYTTGSPDAVTTLATTSIGYTNIEVSWTAPSAGGGNQQIIGYQVNASTPWSSSPTVYINDTGSTATTASIIGLLSGTDYSIRVSAWTNKTNDHPFNNATGNIVNATTIGNVSSETINETIGVVGDTARLVGFVNVTAGGTQSNLTSISIFRNGTLIETNSTIQNSTGTPYGVNIGPFWIRMETGDVYEFEVMATLQNTVETLTNSTFFYDSREYDPVYSAAIDSPETQGNVNATVERFDSEDGILLKVNREGVSTGDTWQIECIAQTNAEAAASKDDTVSWAGDWQNTTNTGYFNTTFTGYADSHAYITCFNEDMLFTLTSFTDSSLALLGIELFDASYGSMLGVPVGIFFLVMTAGMANKRTAPTFIIVITGIAGTMATIGFFSFEPIVWGLALVTAMLGIFVNQKIF